MVLDNRYNIWYTLNKTTTNKRNFTKGFFMSDTTKKLTPQQKYDKESTKTYAVKVMKNTEPEIFEKLESIENKAGYIKKLIRKDIENRSENLVEGETGMTDYQLKVFLKLIKMRAETATKEEFLKTLDDLIAGL